MQVEMKNVKLGHKKDVRLRSEDEIEKVELGRAQKMQVSVTDVLAAGALAFAAGADPDNIQLSAQPTAHSTIQLLRQGL